MLGLSDGDVLGLIDELGLIDGEIDDPMLLPYVNDGLRGCFPNRVKALLIALSIMSAWECHSCCVIR